jgi:hypothetical protein
MKTIWIRLAGVAVMAPSLAMAFTLSELPLVETFEGHTNGTPLSVLGTNGWVASSESVVIQTGVVWQALGSNAVAVPSSAVATNLVNGGAVTNVWTDCYLYESQHIPAGSVGADAVDSNATFQMYFEMNGYPVVYHPENGWLVCSNDYLGTNTAVFNTNTWPRITVCECYTSKTAAIFLNGHLLLDQVPFRNVDAAKTNFTQFRLESGNACTSYLDNVAIRLSRPEDLTLDLDNDGKVDALEIEQYGNMTSWRRLTNTVSATGSGSINPTGTFTVVSGSNVTYTLAASEAYVLGAVTNTGVTTLYGTKTAVYVDANVTNDRTITAAFVYDGIRYVPGDHTTIEGALAAAQAGDRIVVSNGSYAGSIALSNGVTLVGTNMTGTATNLTIQGSVTVATATIVNATSGVLTVTGGVTVVSGGLLVVSNGMVNLGALSIAEGGTVQVVNATAVIGGVTFTGTFELGTTWDSQLVPAAIPFTDDFERYAAGTRMNLMGYFGWGASSSNIVVTDAHAESGVAVELPIQTVLSNVLQATAFTSVWMQCSISEVAHIPAADAALIEEDPEASLMLYINTDDRLVVYDPDLNGGGWHVCSNDIWGASAGLLATGTWGRISALLQYGDGEGRAFLFLNGRLVRENIRLLNAARTQALGLRVDSGTAGSTYLDNVNISAMVPADLAGDRDGDGIEDTTEIDRYGSVLLWPRGSVFKIR